MPLIDHRETYLSPLDDCHGALMAAARSATASLEVLIYGFTLPDLVDVLIEKHQAGITCGVVADQSQAAGHAEHPLLLKLVAAGVPVVISKSPKGGINHQKVLIIDGVLGDDHPDSKVVWGSYNFSDSAAKQANTMIVDNSEALVRRLRQQFAELAAYGRAHCPQLTVTPTSPSSSQQGTETAA